LEDNKNCKSVQKRLEIQSEVNHPKHYNSHPSGIECIEIVRHMNFNLGNVIKYIWRCDNKHEISLTDLEKAKFYLENEICKVEQTLKVKGKKDGR